MARRSVSAERPCAGTATLNRGTEWRYYRCGARCGQPSASADQVEQAVIAATQKAMLPARAMEAAREELARRLRVPSAGLSDKKRQRLLTRLPTAKAMRLEGDLSPDEFRAEKTAIERQLVEVPDSDKLIQFDQHRKVLLSLGRASTGLPPPE